MPLTKLQSPTFPQAYAAPIYPPQLQPSIFDEMSPSAFLAPASPLSSPQQTAFDLSPLSSPPRRKPSLIAAPCSSSAESADGGKCKREMYKTELCKNWEERGFCIYGSRCKFGHGSDELRQKRRIKNFKTKPCADSAKDGMACQFKARCNYAHPGEFIRYKCLKNYFDGEYFAQVADGGNCGIYL